MLEWICAKVVPQLTERSENYEEKRCASDARKSQMVQ